MQPAGAMVPPAVRTIAHQRDPARARIGPGALRGKPQRLRREISERCERWCRSKADTGWSRVQPPETGYAATARSLRGWCENDKVLEDSYLAGRNAERASGQQTDERRHRLRMGGGQQREAFPSRGERLSDRRSPEIDGQVGADLVDEQRGGVGVDLGIGKKREGLVAAAHIETAGAGREEARGAP